MSADEQKTQTETELHDTDSVVDTEASSQDAAAEATAETSSADVSIEDLVNQLAANQEEITKLKDAVIRSEAEMQNVRRRAEKDVEAAHKFSQEKLIKELLPVIDNLERALEASTGEEVGAAKAVLEGVELTHKSFSDTLVKASVVAINPVGETFDPQLHQAMSMVPNPEVPANTVMAVVQKGYSLHGRLVRPAMVMVSSGGPAVSGNNIDETA
ncbi:nucleotide exchange factor GrpE [Salinispirillum sp. LH 10-3-1]|uniref:Protein GrpE n=1 Tax=Salinispirillum sp. LH 10-3-1 TaxID=2952525 RepID=A0AB38YDT2_9GAMM